MEVWTIWWVWVLAGIVLGFLEVVVPGFVFLGFAIGAVITGALIGVGVLGGSLPVAVLVFAVASLAAWLGLRQMLGRHEGQVKLWDKDVND